MRIGLLSDTHGYLDPRIFDHFKECDEVWHAGDFGEGVAEQLKVFKPLRGVFGNIDGHNLRHSFPEELLFTCEEMLVLMIHIGGSPGHYYPEAGKSIAQHKPAIFICGHSHILKVMHDTRNKLLYINPGAAGKHGFHRMRTIIRFEINRQKIERLEAIELGLRGALH